MRRWGIATVLAVAMLASPADALAVVTVTASPNPATVGQRVFHTIQTTTGGSLNARVSAVGFAQPTMGTLPPGTWRWECCLPQPAGAPTWYYHSDSVVAPGTYRFGADALRTGRYLSSAGVGSVISGVWVRIA